MSTKYDGKRIEICRTGGSVRVTTSSNVGQGNGGTSIPCRGCFVSCPSTNSNTVCKMNIAAAASATLGIDIPKGTVSTPLFVPISDVAKLYFYSDDDGGIIDILYLLG